MVRGTPLAFAQVGAAVPSARPERAPTPAAPTEPSEEALALARILEGRLGGRLSADEVRAIARDLDGDLRGGKRLREIKLSNADEPDFTFRA